jgi:hypothetical protein
MHSHIGPIIWVRGTQHIFQNELVVDAAVQAETGGLGVTCKLNLKPKKQVSKHHIDIIRVHAIPLPQLEIKYQEIEFNAAVRELESQFCRPEGNR